MFKKSIMKASIFTLDDTIGLVCLYQFSLISSKKMENMFLKTDKSLHKAQFSFSDFPVE